MASFRTIALILAFLAGAAAVALHKPVKPELSDEECTESKTPELYQDQDYVPDKEWMKLCEKEEEAYQADLKKANSQRRLGRHRIEDDVDYEEHVKQYGQNWNKTLFFLRTQDHKCVPDGDLTEDGIAQCEHIKNKWEYTANNTIEEVWACPQRRCMETAINIFGADKVRISPYIMEYRGVVIKGAGENTLKYMAKGNERLAEEYGVLWTGHDDIHEYSPNRFRHDPDRIAAVNEYVHPRVRFNYFLGKKLRRTRAKHIAIISHKRFIDQTMGMRAGNELSRGEMKVRGLLWLPRADNTSDYYLIPFHEDTYYRTHERNPSRIAGDSLR